MSDQNSPFYKGKCSKCGMELSENDGPFCMQCRIEGVEDSIPEQKERSRSSSSSSNVWKYARWGIIVISLSICVYFLFNMHKMIPPEKPIRNGSYETNAITDECIQNLWRAASLLQSHKKIPNDLVCPLCKKTYIITTDASGVIFISCPDPGGHGCKKLEVNSNNLVPEVRK